VLEFEICSNSNLPEFEIFLNSNSKFPQIQTRSNSKFARNWNWNFPKFEICLKSKFSQIWKIQKRKNQTKPKKTMQIRKNESTEETKEPA
jgi:hypothetical protein